MRSGSHVAKLNDKFKVVVKLLPFLQLSIFLSHPAHISLLPLCPPMVVPSSDISLFVDGHLGRKGLLRANLRESLSQKRNQRSAQKSDPHITPGSALQSDAVCCRALRRVIVCCRVLQRVAVSLYVYQCHCLWPHITPQVPCCVRKIVHIQIAM